MLDEMKKIAKELNIKGFRKLKLKRTRYVIGKQLKFMTQETAMKLMAEVYKVGFEIEDLAICKELAMKGLLDTITIKPKI